jgi:hypothetical protein
MALMEGSYIHGSIIGLACGLGKTLSTLMMVYYTAQEKAAKMAQDPTKGLQHAATLICSPSVSIEVWQADAEKFFPGVFTIHQFYGSRATVTDPTRLKTLVEPHNITGLTQITAGFDPLDIKASYPLLNTFNNLHNPLLNSFNTPPAQAQTLC